MTSSGKHWQPLVGGVEQAASVYNGTEPNSQTLYLEFLLKLLDIKSICDLGCGPGYWVRAAKRLGIVDALGYDIPLAEGAHRIIEPNELIECDLSERYEFGRRFDLAVTTEVIEHIPQKKEKNFVDNCCRASDFVLFSGAVPYQGGVGHVNEQWLEHWSALFQRNGFHCHDLFREHFWHDSRIQYYYRQNTVLFASEEASSALRERGFNPSQNPKTMIHPEMIIQCVNRALPSRDRNFLRDVAEFYDAVKGQTVRSEHTRKHTYGQENLWYRDLTKG